MLTEIDTRQMGTQEVSLFMDTDAQVYLVCVEGYEPITCLTRDRALTAYRHPHVYMPLEASESAPNATEGVRHTSELVQPLDGSESITGRCSDCLVELRSLLDSMSDSDFHWTCSVVADIVRQSGRERSYKPYNRDEEEDIPFE